MVWPRSFGSVVVGSAAPMAPVPKVTRIGAFSRRQALGLPRPRFRRWWLSSYVDSNVALLGPPQAAKPDRAGNTATTSAARDPWRRGASAAPPLHATVTPWPGGSRRCSRKRTTRRGAELARREGTPRPAGPNVAAATPLRLRRTKNTRHQNDGEEIPTPDQLRARARPTAH